MARVVDRWHDKRRNRTKRFGIGKRWMAVWSEGGKEVTKAFTSKDAAEAHLTRTSHEQRAGDYVSERESVTMADYWPIFLQQKSSLSISHRNGMKSAWNAHIAPKWANTPIKAIRGLEVESWFSSLTSAKGAPLSGSAKAKIIICMRSLCELALRDEKVKKNPLQFVKIPKRRKSERRYLTVEQADRLLEAAGDLMEVEVLLKLGLRRGEMAGIKVSDLDVKRNRILIQRSIDVDGSEKSTKTGRSREVPVPVELMGKIVDKSKTRKISDYVFTAPSGRPWTRDTWKAVWRKIAPASGVDNLLTHELRHTAVSWAIAAGANAKAVQRMVGHASAAMTLDVYGHLWDADLDAVMDKVEAFVEGEREGSVIELNQTETRPCF